MRDVKMGTVVVSKKANTGFLSLFKTRYSVLIDLVSGHYVGVDGKLTHSLLAAQDFFGGRRKRKKDAEAFAKQHDFQIV